MKKIPGNIEKFQTIVGKYYFVSNDDFLHLGVLRLINLVIFIVISLVVL